MSLDDDFADARSTLENSAMLCTSTRKAVDEAFKPRPVCAVCGQPKMPHGRSHFGDGCTDSCEGYRQEPHPLNLFFGEQMEIRNLAYELPRILAALDAAEERTQVLESERAAFVLVAALAAFTVDDDECIFDHHGYCQAHGCGDWGDRDVPHCPTAALKDALAALGTLAAHEAVERSEG